MRYVCLDCGNDNGDDGHFCNKCQSDNLIEQDLDCENL